MDSPKAQYVAFSDGFNALMIKAEEGNLDEVQRILNESKQINVNAVNRNNCTALSLAAKDGHYRIVELLLQFGADPNIKNNSGQSPLFLACWNNFLDIVKLLIENNAEINTKDQRGWTPLMIAAFNDRKEIVRLLIEKNADINVKDCFDKTALDRAKDPQIIRMLQNPSKIIQKHNEKEQQKSGSFLINSSPKKLYTIQQLSSLLKKASPTKEAQEARGGQSFSANKTPAERYQKNHSVSGYPVQLSNEKLVGPGDKNDYLTPQNRTRDPNMGFRKNSDPKIATRFERIREERTNTSMDKSYRLTSRSPTKSAVLSSRYARETPTRHKEMRSTTLSSSYTESKKQALKEDVEKDLVGQVEVVSDRIQDLVFQKISLSVPRQMQNFERNLKNELNSLFQFRVDSMFRSLHTSFNLKVKFCLNKLGYDTTNLDLTPFDEGDPAAGHADHRLFENQVPVYNYDKEEEAIESDVYRLHRAVMKGQLTSEQSAYSEYKDPGKRINFPNKGEMINDLLQQLGQEVRRSTEYLMEFSSGRLNDVMREQTNLIHSKMTSSLNRNMDLIEADFKNNFENLVTQKVNDLLESLGRPPQRSEQKDSSDITPSKQLFPSHLKTTDKKPAVQQDLGSSSKEERSVYSEYSSSAARSNEPYSGQKLGSPVYKETEFPQTKSKIEKLKSSLNFIDEDKQPAHEVPEERPKERVYQREVPQVSSQLDKNVLIQDDAQYSTNVAETPSKQPSFMDSIRKEYFENIQAAAKLEELKSFYQKKNDKISVSKGETDSELHTRYTKDQNLPRNLRPASSYDKKPPFK